MTNYMVRVVSLTTGVVMAMRAAAWLPPEMCLARVLKALLPGPAAWVDHHLRQRDTRPELPVVFSHAHEEGGKKTLLSRHDNRTRRTDHHLKRSLPIAGPNCSRQPSLADRAGPMRPKSHFSRSRN